MEWLKTLFLDQGIGHSIMLLAITIVLGILLGRIKIANISLGITWILFVGILLSHFGLRVEGHLLHFVKELGLILFVYSIGLQVGPGFFASFRQGGLRLNLLATTIVLLGVAITCIIHVVTGTDLATMVGILSGAVTNTPGLGAAQQTYSDIMGNNNPNIALGYAVAYPLGVVGIILSTIVIRYLCNINLEKEHATLEKGGTQKDSAQILSIVIKNEELSGKTIKEIFSKIAKPVVISRIKYENGDIAAAHANDILHVNDTVRITVPDSYIQEVIRLIGIECKMDDHDWETSDHNLVSRRLVVTKSGLNGQKLGTLNIRSLHEVTITRINRAGIDFVANYNFQLQMGDRITVVGRKENVQKVAAMVGNSMKRLEQPNLIPIFLGIFIGIIVGSIPFVFPGIPQPVKLGLAGGPLIVAILIGRYGPYYKMITFTTTSANMMIREIGISLFLAAVGLSAGEGFIETIVNGGYWWILFGFIITIVPLLMVGIFARLRYKMDYFTLIGLISGSTTDPPALAFANSISNNDAPSVAYATVYPLTMFLRVLTAQILMVFALA